MTRGKQTSGGLVRIGVILCLCLVWTFSGGVSAQTRHDGRPEGEPELLDLWFALRASGPVYAPYAYLLLGNTVPAQQARKAALLKVLGKLSWRLEASSRSVLAKSLTEWSRHIDAADNYRTPGQWGPAALLAEPDRRVPVARIAAIGACRIPEWVEVWSLRGGVQRIEWRSSMRLSALLSRAGVAQRTQADHVTVVTPYGRTVERGIGASVQQDMALSPGMRVVVPLPMNARAAAWIEGTLAAFLAHLVPSNTCRQLHLDHVARGARPAEAKDESAMEQSGT